MPVLAFFCYSKSPQIEWLKTTSIYISHFLWARSWPLSVAQLVLYFESDKAKIEVSAGLCSFLSGGEPASCSFRLSKFSFRRLLDWGPVVCWQSLFSASEAAYVPWLMAPFKASNSGLSSSQAWNLILLLPHFPKASLLPSSSAFKGPYDYIGPAQITQDNLPILRSLNLSAESLSP